MSPPSPRCNEFVYSEITNDYFIYYCNECTLCNELNRTSENINVQQYNNDRCGDVLFNENTHEYYIYYCSLCINCNSCNNCNSCIDCDSYNYDYNIIFNMEMDADTGSNLFNQD